MRISEFLSSNGVRIGISLSDQNQAIDELIALHQSVGNLNDPTAFKETILAREAKGSTAIGMGIAVPHGKSVQPKKPVLSLLHVLPGLIFIPWMVCRLNFCL